MTYQAASDRPTTELDLFSEQLADAPYDAYRRLRDQAAAVYVPAHDFWVVPRYDDVRAASLGADTFSSAQGVALLAPFNEPMLGSVLASDGQAHERLRAILAEYLAPRAIRALRGMVQERVDRVVGSAVKSGAVDGVKDIAQRVPVAVVGDLIGLPEDGRESLLPGADATFTSFGPFTSTLEQRMPAFLDYQRFMSEVAERRSFAPGSWGAAIYAAVDEGRISDGDAMGLLQAYLVAGLDTTSNAISALLRLYAEDSDVWEAVKQEPSLAPSIFEEILRMESPVQGFFRVTTREITLDGVTVPSDARVLLHYGSANRDERHYPDPDQFQMRRNPLDHLAFGYGPHGCAGQGLARMEAAAITSALLARVDRIELGGAPTRHYNPVIRGLEKLPLRLQAEAV